MQIMQRHGVPAGVVNNAEDVYNDPQLKSRGHVWLLDHREMGPVGHLGTPGKLSKTPATPKMPAPCLGEHTEFVCTSFLGMSDDEFTKLFSAGAFGKF
jgi:crotonobetainyl-CoA:carnitine CoA-transferase CaiB-like acyl-CoA transferase